MNELVSSLLVHECNVETDELLYTPPFLSQAITAARTLGLHHEARMQLRQPVEVETCRRLWWHLLWLESFATVSSGMAPASGDDDCDTATPVDITDVELNALSTLGTWKLSQEQPVSTSMVMHIKPVTRCSV